MTSAIDGIGCRFDFCDPVFQVLFIAKGVAKKFIYRFFRGKIG